MKISVIQPGLAWENKSENFNNLESLITPLYNSTDIVVLPEMFNTGFSMNTYRLGESEGDETFSWMKSIAISGNFGVCGSYIIKENNRFFNRWMFVSPDEEVWKYDKRHLFSMGDEDKHFTAGTARLIFTFRSVRISPYICYDLRFPVWSRNRNEYDLAIYSANWPEVRHEVWKTLLAARAIENQCYVAGANIVGKDGLGITYKGGSLILDPRGRIIEECDSASEGSITAELSMKDLTDFREKFPVFRDADEFTLRNVP